MALARGICATLGTCSSLIKVPIFFYFFFLYDKLSNVANFLGDISRSHMQTGLLCQRSLFDVFLGTTDFTLKSNPVCF